MVIYRSDVPDHRDTCYTVDGDMFMIKDHNGVIGFHIPKKKDQTPLYIKLFGNPGEPIRDEIDRLLEAVLYMRRRPIGMSEQDYEEKIASILGMKYGRYMEKKRKGEIQYFMKEQRR